MNFFQEALNSKRSTILYGSFGRYPRLAKFYLDAIPELNYASDYELIFWYKNQRLLYVMFEPPFNAIIPSDKWFLILTSHLRLKFNTLTTRIIHTHLPVNTIPFPQNPTANQNIIVPPTSHVFEFYDRNPTRIDLSNIDNPHEAYLRLLTFYDVLQAHSEWSLLIPDKLRKKLIKNMPQAGPYDSHLLKILG